MCRADGATLVFDLRECWNREFETRLPPLFPNRDTAARESQITLPTVETLATSAPLVMSPPFTKMSVRMRPIPRLQTCLAFFNFVVGETFCLQICCYSLPKVICVISASFFSLEDRFGSENIKRRPSLFLWRSFNGCVFTVKPGSGDSV